MPCTRHLGIDVTGRLALLSYCTLASCRAKAPLDTWAVGCQTPLSSVQSQQWATQDYTKTLVLHITHSQYVDPDGFWATLVRPSKLKTAHRLTSSSLGPSSAVSSSTTTALSSDPPAPVLATPVFAAAELLVFFCRLIQAAAPIMSAAPARLTGGGVVPQMTRSTISVKTS